MPEPHWQRIKPLRSPEGSMCGTCDGLHEHEHECVRCSRCGKEGLRENWPFRCCGVSEKPEPSNINQRLVFDLYRERIRRLEDTNTKLRAALAELADSHAETIEGLYGDMQDYPSMQARKARDLAEVEAARALLAELEGSDG